MKAAMLLTLALTGCATTEGYTPASASQINTPLAEVGVLLKVRWMNPAQIARQCGADKLACAFVGKLDLPESAIWTEKPTGWDDHRRVCALGHEVLHSLGARH